MSAVDPHTWDDFADREAVTASLGCTYATDGPNRKCEHTDVQASGGECAMEKRMHTVEDELAAEDRARAEARRAEG